MKKIPTLFVREFERGRVISCKNETAPGLEWILTDPGVIPTIKKDGSCCMIDKYGKLWRRYDAKAGRSVPYGAIPCEPAPDPVTGHWPHWVPVRADRFCDKWYMDAFLNTRWNSIKEQPGTYEAIGPAFQGNPYNLKYNYLYRHGSECIKDMRMSYAGIEEWLRDHYEEGIVFWYDGAPVAKIKGSDFGFHWGSRKGGD